MSEERLSSLALMKIHHKLTKNIDLDKVVELFALKHPRRMLLPNMLAQ